MNKRTLTWAAAAAAVFFAGIVFLLAQIGPDGSELAGTPASERFFGPQRPRPDPSRVREEVVGIPADPPSVAAGPVEVPEDATEEGIGAEPEAVPPPSGRGGGRVEETVLPEQITRTRENSTRDDLERELRDVESDLARRKNLLGKAEWSRGEWHDQEPGQGLPRSTRTRWDGIPEEIYYQRARNADGKPIVRYVTLPFERYPEYYDLKAEANRLRGEVRLLAEGD